MADISNLVIPAELLPADGRFGAGPSKVRDEQMAALVAGTRNYMGTSHRQSTVKDQVGRLRDGLTKLFDLPEGYEVVVGNGGTTAFWEMAVFSLIRERGQFLTFGEFGSKFASSAKAAPFLGEHQVIKSEPGDAPSFAPASGFDVYATPHNETSTGVAIAPARPVGMDEDALLLIDATSAAGGLAVDISQVDVYYFAPQKCFASDGGLFIAIMSPKAIARALEIKASGRYIPAFLDLVTALENSRLNQTYNTPSLATILLMAEQIDWFNALGGMQWTTARTAESAGILYSWAAERDFVTPFVSDAAKQSNVVVTLDFADGIDASEIAKTLRKNAIVDTDPYRKLGRNQLRISVFPAVDPSDVRKLTESLDFIVSQINA